MTADERQRPRRRRGHGADDAVTPASATARSPTATDAGVDLAGIEAAACGLLADLGIAICLPAELIARCTAAGLAASPTRLRFPERRLQALIAAAPRRFTHVAGDDRRSLEVSTTLATFGPALTARHVWTGATRRPLTLADAALFAGLADDLPALGVGAAALLLEPLAGDGAARARAFVRASTKPLIAMAGPAVVARELVAALDPDPGCRLMIIAPIQSCLTFEASLVDALGAAGDGGQGLVISPTILIGANAPATRIGAVTRFTAEAMAGVALVQALYPGMPVAVGGTFADISMRNGLPIVGTANAVATMAGAMAMARRWQLPFYALGPATGGMGFDATSAAETSRWLTAAYHLGGNVVLGAIGAVDLDDGISMEKLIADAESAAALGWPGAAPVDPTAELMAVGPGGHFLGTLSARYLARSGDGQPGPPPQLFESWQAAGVPNAFDRLTAMVAAARANLPVQAAPAGLPDGGPAARPGGGPVGLADLAASVYSRAIRDAFGFRG